MKKQDRRMSLLWLVSLLSVITTGAFAQAPDTLWTRTYGGANDEIGYSVQQTSDEGYIIAGFTRSFGAGDQDVYLIKTDSKGDTLWTKTYGGIGDEYGRSVQETSDKGFIITGTTNSYGAGVWDVYLIKTDSLGDTLWTKTYGGIYSDGGCSVQQTNDAGYIIVGYIRPYATDIRYIYLIKIDSVGNEFWSKTYGDSIDDYVARSVQQTNEGGYIVAGYVDFPSGIDVDVYLIKTDSLGDTLWTKTYGDSMPDYGYSVQQTTDTGYIVAGKTHSFGAGMFDVYLIKTDSLGDTLWTKTYGGLIYDIGYSVQQTFDEGYIIAGWTDSFGAVFEYDIYLIKTDSLGDTLWTKRYGGTYPDQGFSVQQTSDSGYIVAGYTNSFGAGLYDVYLIKTGPDTLGIEENKITNSKPIAIEVFPNPCWGRINIRWQLADDRLQTTDNHLQIKIYDVGGQLVRVFSINQLTNSPIHHIIWDGRDKSGSKVSSGIYFLKFKAGDYSATAKLLLIR